MNNNTTNRHNISVETDELLAELKEMVQLRKHALQRIRELIQQARNTYPRPYTFKQLAEATGMPTSSIAEHTKTKNAKANP